MNLHKCILTRNDCYSRGKHIIPKGIMVHSTGVNNPNIKRYVQPNDGIIGENRNNNDWNRPGISKCVHAFIGKTADGSVATYQTLPWDMRGWHCGRSGNDTHISFEICEDDLTDANYFNKVYREAVELTAYLCKMYNLDPLADGVVICHYEGYKRGIASGHSDVEHWFPKFGKTMDMFRVDVSAEMNHKDTEDEEDMTLEQFTDMFKQMRKQLKDNDAGQYSEEARKWVIESGLFVGNGEKVNGEPNYMWEDMLTREQFAMVLYRFAKMMGKA